MTLRIMSLNMWCLPRFYGISQDQAFRLEALGEALPSLHLDILALQEVWQEADAEFLMARAKAAGMAHSQYYSAGAFGAGLLILSRHPIRKIAYGPYRLSSNPFQQSDYYTGKGIAMAEIATAQGTLAVYNTHLIHQQHAEDIYMGHRAAQAYDAAQFIQRTSSGHPTVVCGDFNFLPDALGYHLFAAMTGFTDAFAALHPDDAGITYSTHNIYNSAYRYDERLDYIWLGNGARRGIDLHAAEIALQSIPHAPHLPYSDHYAVCVELDLQADMNKPAEPSPTLGEMLRRFDVALGGAQLMVADQARGHRARGVLAIGAAVLALIWGTTGKSRGLLAGVVVGVCAAYAALQFWVKLTVSDDESHTLQTLRDEIAYQMAELESAE